MEYRKSESNIRPKEAEAISNGRYFVRKNITKKTKTNDEGKEIVFYQYDEAIASEPEFAAIMAAQTIKIMHEDDIIDAYTMQLIEEGVI